MRGDPTVVRHRSMANPENAAVRQFDDRVVGFVGGGNLLAPDQVVAGAYDRRASSLASKVDDFGEQHAGFYGRRVEAIHVDITAVADDEPLFAIEEAKSLRHVVQCAVEAACDLSRVGLLLQRNYFGVSRAFAFA